MNMTAAIATALETLVTVESILRSSVSPCRRCAKLWRNGLIQSDLAALVGLLFDPFLLVRWLLGLGTNLSCITSYHTTICYIVVSNKCIISCIKTMSYCALCSFLH